MPTILPWFDYQKMLKVEIFKFFLSKKFLQRFFYFRLCDHANLSSSWARKGQRRHNFHVQKRRNSLSIQQLCEFRFKFSLYVLLWRHYNSPNSWSILWNHTGAKWRQSRHLQVRSSHFNWIYHSKIHEKLTVCVERLCFEIHQKFTIYWTETLHLHERRVLFGMDLNWWKGWEIILFII